MDFKEIGYEDVNWIQLVRGRDKFRHTVINLRVPYRAMNILTS
jgi:hypothetical protein